MGRKSPGSRDPRGRRRKPKGTPPAIDESIRIWVPAPGDEWGRTYECPPGVAEVLARYEDRRHRLWFTRLGGSADLDAADMGELGELAEAPAPADLRSGHPVPDDQGTR